MLNSSGHNNDDRNWRPQAVKSDSLIPTALEIMTETVLARAVDRRAAEDQMGLTRTDRAKNTSEVRRAVSYWARALRERLDELKVAAEQEPPAFGD